MCENQPSNQENFASATHDWCQLPRQNNLDSEKHLHSEPCVEFCPGWTSHPKTSLNPREDKPALIKFAAVPPQAGWAALTDGANMTYTEPKDEEEESETESMSVPWGSAGSSDSPHVARFWVFVEFMEPGLLGLPTFCSGDQAVFVLVQFQECSPCRVSFLGGQQTYQWILGRIGSGNISFPAVIQGPTEDIFRGDFNHIRHV